MNGQEISTGVTVYQGDALEVLRTLPSESVNCVVTSPPYWGLRDYGIPPSIWGGELACEHRFEFGAPTSETNYTDKRRWQHTRNGRDEEQPVEKRVGWKRETVEHGTFCRCGAWRGAFGLEPTPELYVEHAVEIFREVGNVLRDDGTLWLNIGDSYAAHPGQRVHDGERNDVVGWKQATNAGSCTVGLRAVPGIKPKDLVGIPWMLAFALRADGWYLRQDIVWSKPNPMPESVTDRCTKAHEYIFLVSKRDRYYFNQSAILEPVSPSSHMRISQNLAEQVGSHRANGGGKTNGPMKAVGRKAEAGEVGVVKHNSSFDSSVCLPVSERNKRSVWTVNVQGFAEAHFATFPEELIKPCILAGCPAGGTVLDPFFGSGTTGLVAQANGCKCIGIELNPAYIEIAKRRLRQETFDFSSAKP